MPNFIEFVKTQVSFHDAMAERYKKVPDRRKRHTETAQGFRDLAAHLEALEAGQDAVVTPVRKKPAQLNLTFEEVEGLPPELVEELSISGGDRTDFTVLRVVEATGGIASLDRILIGIYRETGEITKRSTLTSRLYRMCQKGLLYNVPNKKGVYSLEEMTEADVAELFGS